VHHTAIGDGYSAGYEGILKISFVISHDKQARGGGCKMRYECQIGKGGISCGCNGASTDTIQQSVQIPNKEVDINHITVYVSGTLKPIDWNVVSQTRPTVWCQQIGFVSCRHFGQIPAAGYIGFLYCCNGQTYLIELVRDMRFPWDQRDKYYHNRGPKPKFWD
jgi:hypothetical protein